MRDPSLSLPLAAGCLEDGAMIAAAGPIIGAERQDEDDPQFTIGIALDEPPIVECKPLIPTLTQLRGAVDEVLKLLAPILAT
jgi:hypothetical protein